MMKTKDRASPRKSCSTNTVQRKCLEAYATNRQGRVSIVVKKLQTNPDSYVITTPRPQSWKKMREVPPSNSNQPPPRHKRAKEASFTRQVR